MKERVYIVVVLLAVVLQVGPASLRGELVWNGKEWVQPAPPEPGTDRYALSMIRQSIQDGEDKQAVKLAEQFLVNHAASPLCEEAMCLAGQAEMNRGHYWDAYKWFERQVATYPNGPFFERALDREFAIGSAFLDGRRRRVFKILRLSAIDDGIDILMRIAGHAPGTEIAERALLRVGDHHFNHQQYPEAIAVYDEFVHQNPSSARRPYAMLQAARANLLDYRGVRWDETPLLEAAERYRVFAQAYPKAGRTEDIPGVLREIRMSLAHKVFHAGQFYERTHHPRSAVFYYRRVINEYGDTHWADSARARLERMQGIAPQAPPVGDQPTYTETPVGPAEPDTQAESADLAPSPPDQPDTPADVSPPDAPEPRDDGPRPILLEELPNR